MKRYKAIERRVRELSDLVGEIIVVEEAGIGPVAYITPDFKAASAHGIVNLTDEIRWYAVELYNIEASDEARIRAWHVTALALPDCDTPEGCAALKRLAEPAAVTPCDREIDDPVYATIREELERLSGRIVCPDSRFEFDLGLDSIDHVALYTFLEATFGVHVHDREFATMMTPETLYRYVKAHASRHTPTAVDWSQILRTDRDTVLRHSPWVLGLYRLIALPLFRLYFRLERRGMEHLPECPCIIAPSHQSMLDGFIITASLPWRVLRHTFTLAFEQVFGVTPAATYGQLILIDVNNDLKASMQKAAVPLMQGENLVIFPEGARSRDRQLLEFRPFAAMLAKEFNVPIVPTLLDGGFEALRAGMLFPRPAKISVRFLEPIYPREDESAEVLTARVKLAIKEAMRTKN